MIHMSVHEPAAWQHACVGVPDPAAMPAPHADREPHPCTLAYALWLVENKQAVPKQSWTRQPVPQRSALPLWPCSSDPRQLAIAVRGVGYGRARLTLRYDDEAGSRMAVQYFVLPPLQEHVRRFGAFQAGAAWFEALPGGRTDPFGRAPSAMPWDRQARQHVLHDPRWDAPLSLPGSTCLQSGSGTKNTLGRVRA